MYIISKFVKVHDVHIDIFFLIFQSVHDVGHMVLRLIFYFGFEFSRAMPPEVAPTVLRVAVGCTVGTLGGFRPYYIFNFFRENATSFRTQQIFSELGKDSKQVRNVRE